MDYDMEVIFISAASGFTNESRLIDQMWKEIELAYNYKNRCYHTMKHLQHVYSELLPVKQNIRDWDCVLFSLFYHDIIYNPTRQDNELKSAAVAKEHLELIYLPIIKIEKCIKMIMATRDHANNDDDDINYFTDADLSILGSNRSAYIEYYLAVRNEYSVLPDSVYKPGRKMALQHFIKMSTIFKTEYFIGKYEKTARQNIAYELKTL